MSGNLELLGFNWSRRQSTDQSSSMGAEVDFLSLCEKCVRSIKAGVANNGRLLNKRQCSDLAAKLSKTTLNVGKLVSHGGAPAALSFRPALENLYRYLNKSKLLVDNCGEKRWLAAAVFQMQNENGFREILLEVGLCYNVIYDLTKSQSKDWKDRPEVLRLSRVFQPAADSHVQEDKEDLQKRLEDYLVKRHGIIVKVQDLFRRRKRALKECLARYLLLKLDFTSKQSQANTFGSCSEILWQKETEPPRTWGPNSTFLGSGSGSNGVCSTKWLGIPCAKKEFEIDPLHERFFLKEAGILAHLKHPSIINLFCCCTGLEEGHRFIAMELMEKSLFDLIKEQKKKGEHFSLPVLVDMMVQMARGMCYLHDQGVAHRDLKPQNVVVTKMTSPYLEDYYCIKLVDFGTSKIKVEVNRFYTISYRGVGTAVYRAPEVIPMVDSGGIVNSDGTAKARAFWFKADAFSFAMTCAHLLSLKIPFEDICKRTTSSELHQELTISELYKEVKKGRRPELPLDCPPELIGLLRDCWHSDPHLRPSFREVCTRLEAFRYKLLSGFSALEEGSQEKPADFDFIQKKLKEQSSIIQRHPVDKVINITDEVEGETFDLQENNENGSVNEGGGEDYRSETCQFDEHPGRAHALSTTLPRK